MKAVTCEGVATAVGGKVCGKRGLSLSSDGLCTGASIDSRMVTKGDIFVPLRGLHTDGHQHVIEALKRAASCFFFERRARSIPEVIKALTLGTGIEVENCAEALKNLGAWNLRRLTIWVAAVTGSNGKTTTKEMIGTIFAGNCPTFVSPGNLNNDIGLPLNLVSIEPKHQIAVLEMGMNHAGEIAELCRLARPDAGVITNVGPAHLEYLGSIENIAMAKAELLDGLKSSGVAVLNCDDPWVKKIGKQFAGKKIWYGLSSQADIRAVEVETTVSGGTRFTLITPDGVPCPVKLPLAGEHNVLNALAGAALAWHRNIPGKWIAEALASFSGVEGRMEIIEGPGYLLVNDCYNANPASLAAALEGVKVLGDHRLVVVLSDMLELGETAGELHRAAGRNAARSGVALLFAWGEYASCYAQGAREGGLEDTNVVVCESKEQMTEALRLRVKKGDMVLFKASRAQALETVLERLF